MLEAQSSLTLLRRFFLAAFCLVAGGVCHRVRFVEDDNAVETCPGLRAGVAAEPVDDLLNPADLFTPGSSPGQALRLGAQGGVGGEENAFVERDRGALAETRQWRDVGAVAANRDPVALGILDQLVGLGDPDRPAAAFQPVVKQGRGDLAALAGA